MANLNQVIGFEPWGECLRSRAYVATAPIYPGDPVKQDSSGNVVVATAGDALIGMALTYAGTTGDQVMVADHPSQEFVSQADDGSITAQTDCGLNYNTVFGTASTRYKRSGSQIDASTGATNSNYPLKVLHLAPIANNAFGTNCKLICKINNHQLSAGTGTLGV